MGKRIAIAVLWGLAVWTWVSMAQVFLGVPNVGLLAGLLTTAAIVSRGMAWARTRGPAVESGPSLVSKHS